MRITNILLLTVVAFGCQANKAPDIKQGPDQLRQKAGLWLDSLGNQNHLTKRYDEFKKLSFYKDQASTNYVDVNEVSLYLVYDKATPAVTLRLKIQYAGADWLFIRQYHFKADSNVVTLTPDDGEFVRETESGGVYEYVDLYIQDNTADNYRAIKAIVDAKKIKLRMDGSHAYKDRLLGSQEVESIRNVFEIYNAIHGY